MQETENQAEKLIKIFSADYVQKLFYFFLKKTSSTEDAEDLTSETAICIITQLRKNTIPVYFSAWVWKIARNRYCKWAAKKHYEAVSVSGADFQEDDVCTNTSIEEQYVMNEEKILLRRELALISSDYRDIVVAYYIDDRKIRDIAMSLHLPEGTVKTRLFKARKILKEGMNMAREFGMKSYKPEEVTFSASGSQPSGLPWKAVQRKIPKNIILQASNNPSIIEELSIELGIAMPYMEEEVALLTDATLLKRIENNKYITNFFIADKDCQVAVYQAQRRFSKERSEILDKIVTESIEQIKELNIIRNGMSDEDFKWLIILRGIDHLLGQSVPMDSVNKGFKRPDRGNWGFIGLEVNTGITEIIDIGHNGNGNNSAMFWAYKINDYNLRNRVGEMKYSQALLMGDIIKNNRVISSFTESEKELWKKIEGRFAHTDKDGRIIPDIAVFENRALDEFYKILSVHPLFKSLKEKINKLYKEVIEILKTYSNPVLHENLDYYASMFMFDIRMMTIHDEVEAGRLIVPQNPEKSTIAMYIVIN